MNDTEDQKGEKSSSATITTSSTAEMFPLNIKIKQEKTTSYEDSSKSETVDKLSIDLNLSNIFSSTTTTKAAPPATAAEATKANESEKETKSVEPIKSSNEILTELFKVFNAAPPEIVDDDSMDGEEKKKKKKKHKKKSKKKKKAGSERESSSASNSEEEGEIKKKVKKIKKEKDAEKDKEKQKHKKHKTKDKNKEKVEHNEGKLAVKTEMSSVVVVKKEPKDDRYYSRDARDSREPKDFHHHRQK